MADFAWIDDDQFPIQPAEIEVEAGVMVFEVGIRESLDEVFSFSEKFCCGPKLFGFFLEGKEVGAEVDGVCDSKTIDECGWNRSRGLCMQAGDA